VLPDWLRIAQRNVGTGTIAEESDSMAGANTLHFTDSTFADEVLGSDVPVLVDFWAEWCGPCVRLGPTIDELAEHYAGRAKVGKVNTDANQKTAAAYGISSIPTVLVFANGELKERIIGLRSKRDYEAILDGLIA
jgi:thioredoxin